MIPRKVPPIPHLFYNRDCTIVYKGETNIYGEYEELPVSYKCKFHEQTKRILDSEHNTVVISGIALIDGATPLTNAVDCDFVIDGITYKVYTVKGVTNPDGSIHHYKLELV